MNRRSFAALLGTGILLSSRLQVDATPEASPVAEGMTGRPAPVDLGSGITLIDYRVYPAAPRARLIGELRSTSDQMIDAPVVSLTYPGNGDEESGFAYATPMIPVMEPGGAVPIFGTLPPPDSSAADVLQRARFALCSSAEPGKYTKRERQLSLSLTILDELLKEDAYRCKGEVTNNAGSPARDVAVRGIVRDSTGRVAGSAATVNISVLKAGETKAFSLYAGGSVQTKANPFALLDGTDYSAEISAGTRGPVVLPGCSFGKPWD